MQLWYKKTLIIRPGVYHFPIAEELERSTDGEV